MNRPLASYARRFSCSKAWGKVGNRESRSCSERQEAGVGPVEEEGGSRERSGTNGRLLLMLGGWDFDELGMERRRGKNGQKGQKGERDGKREATGIGLGGESQGRLKG